jgi:hypothetical protein
MFNTQSSTFNIQVENILEHCSQHRLQLMIEHNTLKIWIGRIITLRKSYLEQSEDEKWRTQSSENELIGRNKWIL